MDKRKITGLVMLLFSAVIFGVLFKVLPDNIVIQIGINGQASNTQPKLTGLLVPFLISSAGALMYGFAGKDKKTKSLILFFAGIAAFILTFVFNR